MKISQQLRNFQFNLTLKKGTIILNSRQETFEGVTDEIIQDFISRGHMNRDYKANLKAIILSQHRDHLTIAGALTGKKAPISELFSSNWKHAKMSSHSFSDNFGSSLLRRSSSHVNHHGKRLSKFEDAIHLSDVILDEKNVCH